MISPFRIDETVWHFVDENNEIKAIVQQREDRVIEFTVVGKVYLHELEQIYFKAKDLAVSLCFGPIPMPGKESNSFEAARRGHET